jgi:hypothetical protein
MAEREVNSPFNSRNTASRLSGNIPGFNPGAKSAPGRGDQAPSHKSEPPPHERTVQQSAEPAEPGTTGPAAAARGDSVSLGQSMLDYYLRRSLGAAQIKITRPGD